MKNKLIQALPFIAVFLLMTIPMFAQNSNPKVPIDGGLSALLAAGAGYGVKKLSDRRKKK